MDRNGFKIEHYDDPSWWVANRPVKWVDDDGNTHKTYVVPINKLKKGHLFNICFSPKHNLEELEPGSLLEQRVKLAWREYYIREEGR